MKNKWEIWESIFLYFILALMVLLCLFPFYLMITGGFKDNAELITMEQTIWPKQIDLRKYYKLFGRYPYWRNLFNSAFVSGSRTLLTIFFCSLAGFAFAKYPFPGRKPLFIFLLGTMMVPFQSIVVPSYLLIRAFHWLNTYYGLIIPMAIPAFGTFLMRQYIAAAVPDEVLDAARTDGCSEFRLFWSIVLPMVKPGIWVLAILTLMGSWNEFLWPFVIVSKEEMFTTPLIVQSIAAGGIYVDYGVALAACSLGALPLLITFLFIQKKFISNLMSGFLKG